MAKTLQTASPSGIRFSTATVRLDCRGIVIHTIGPNRRSISSSMRHTYPRPDEFDEVLDYLEAIKNVDAINTLVRALEALILAHHCAGLDVESPAYCAGIDAAYTAVTSH